MKQYLDLIQKIIDTGVDKGDRTGTGTRSIFGHQMRFDLKEEFPIIKSKYTAFRLVAVELLWFLKGETNIKYLLDNNCHIWDSWADKDGNLGPVYGSQWRKWETNEPIFKDSPIGFTGLTVHEQVGTKKIDQIADVINQLKNNPDSRRIIVSAWNVGDLEKMALPPCHSWFQFYTRPLSFNERHKIFTEKFGKNALKEERELINEDWVNGILNSHNVSSRALSCQLYQRSCDVPIGLPFNIASYALLTHMIAQCVNMVPDEFIWTGGDCHIYNNQMDGVNEMMSRELITEKAKLKLNPEITNIDSFVMEDIKLINYKHHPSIKLPVAV